MATISDARLSKRADQAAIAERLLSISGEDALTLDRKNREHWHGTLAVRFLLMSNELPAIEDASGAFASRFILLKLTRSFFGEEDLTLTRRLLRELPGIVNWGLEGWHRLEQRGAFVQPEAGQADLDELAALSSPLRTFVADKCELGPNRTIKTKDLYKLYQIWCIDKGRRPSSDGLFGKDLVAAFPSIRKERPREDGERVLVYGGIGERLWS